MRPNDTDHPTELITLSELATFLNVSERTIYDWIQQGEVPAYKLGGAWRFRMEEIDGWLALQRTGPLANSGIASECSVCSRPLTSSLPLGERCEHPDCDQSICRSCWGTVRRRRCPTHLQTPVSGPQIAEALQSNHSPELAIGGDGSSWPSFSLISGRFLDSFSSRVERWPYLVRANGSVVAKVKSWTKLKESEGSRHSQGDRRGRRRGRRGRVRGAVPFSSVSYVIPVAPGSLDTRHTIVRLEAQVVEAESLRTRATTSQPVNSQALTELLDSALQVARDEKTHYVLGMYSADGWTEDARQMFQRPESGMRFLNPNLSPAIIGQDFADVVWNPSDSVIPELVTYFRATFDDEVALCKDRVRELVLDGVAYLVSRVIDEEGFAPGVARATIDALTTAKEVELVTEHGQEEAIVKRSEL